MEKFLGKLPENVLGKIFVFTSHPCGDIVKDSFKLLDERRLVEPDRFVWYLKPRLLCLYAIIPRRTRYTIKDICGQGYIDNDKPQVIDDIWRWNTFYRKEENNELGEDDSSDTSSDVSEATDYLEPDWVMNGPHEIEEPDWAEVWS